MSGDQARHALAFGRISLAARDGWGEAVLIDRQKLEAETTVPFMKPQHPSSMQRTALFVAGHLFRVHPIW